MREVTEHCLPSLRGWRPESRRLYVMEVMQQLQRMGVAAEDCAVPPRLGTLADRLEDAARRVSHTTAASQERLRAVRPKDVDKFKMLAKLALTDDQR